MALTPLRSPRLASLLAKYCRSWEQEHLVQQRSEQSPWQPPPASKYLISLGIAPPTPRVASFILHIAPAANCARRIQVKHEPPRHSHLVRSFGHFHIVFIYYLYRSCRNGVENFGEFHDFHQRTTNHSFPLFPLL